MIQGVLLLKGAIPTLFLLMLQLPSAVNASFNAFGSQKPFQDVISSHFSSYDITLMKVFSTLTDQQLNTTSTKYGHETSITVLFTAFSKPFKLLLLRNRLMFSSAYVEKSVTRSTVHHHSSNVVSDHCYYTGKVQQFEHNSTVALSTCNGLRGFVNVEGEVYHIEPESDDIRGRHFVIEESSRTQPSEKCGNEQEYAAVGREFDKRQKRSAINWPGDLDSSTKVVEIYIVNSYSQFKSQSSDSQKVIARTKDILNVVNALYESQNIYFVLVGIEVWTDQEQITIDASNSSATLYNFLQYRRTNINPLHDNDNAQLITSVNFTDGYVGMAGIRSMCSYRGSGGINKDFSPVMGAVGLVMAHEIGHNFGLIHDTDVPGCQCNDATANCIMYPFINATNLATRWSSCSNSSFRYELTHGLDYCLKNIPATLFNLSSLCGNGIVEEGEQCDCGRILVSQECNAKCCNSTTCQLIGEAKCALGRCCDVTSCQIRSKSYECRPSQGSCDLSEYCDGRNQLCPSDVYKRDSTECMSNGVKAYCYQGRCRSHESQCQLLWGRSSFSSNAKCYRTFNVRGNFSGNCGITDWNTLSYKACNSSDVMCGQLLCARTGTLLNFASLPHTNVYASVEWFTCNSTIIDAGTQRQTPSLVPNGAKCADDKMCLNQQCRNVSTLTFPSCFNNCYGNGVCNSLGQCHCNVGYDPSSNCSRPGCGGSIHSGSPLLGCVAHQKLNQLSFSFNEIEQNGKSHLFVGTGKRTNVGLVTGLCNLFILILPSLVSAVVYVCRRQQQRKKRITCPASQTTRQTRSRPHPPPTTAADIDLSVLPSSASDHSSSTFIDLNQNSISVTRPAPARPAPPPLPAFAPDYRVPSVSAIVENGAASE